MGCSRDLKIDLSSLTSAVETLEGYIVYLSEDSRD